jgi:hypothetical protein
MEWTVPCIVCFMAIEEKNLPDEIVDASGPKGWCLNGTMPQEGCNVGAGVYKTCYSGSVDRC